MRASIADVYDAVFDDSALVAVCEKICSHNPAGALVLHYVEHETGRRTIFHCVGLTDAQRAALEADTSMLDIGLADIESLAPHDIRSNLDYVDRELIRSSAAWREHLGQLDAERVDFLCLRKSITFTALLSLAYPKRGEEAARAGTDRALRQVGPHLAHAMDLRGRRFQDLDAQSSALIGRIGSPVLLLDAAGRPVRCNEAAASYFAGCPSAEGSNGSELTPRAGRRLDDLLDALGPLAEDPRDIFYMDHDGNHVLASASEYPLPAAPLLRAQWAEESLAHPTFLILMKVAQGRFGGLAQELVESFKLTPAERRLLEGILTGMTLAEIAEERRVSYNTLKNQLRSVNEKTGIHRQTNLVRVFSSLS